MSTLQTVCENPTLHQIHRSKISLHHAKTGYDYPAIRLPFTFSKLAGLQTCIYQTVHEGSLAFLVVVSFSNKRDDESKSFDTLPGEKINQKTSPLALDSRIYTAKVGRSNRLEPICFWSIVNAAAFD